VIVVLVVVIVVVLVLVVIVVVLRALMRRSSDLKRRGFLSLSLSPIAERFSTLRMDRIVP
jgi:hypothetical protein